MIEKDVDGSGQGLF